MIVIKYVIKKRKFLKKKNIFDDPNLKIDINLAKKMLEWEPRNNLDSGLTKTIEYFKTYGK